VLCLPAGQAPDAAALYSRHAAHSQHTPFSLLCLLRLLCLQDKHLMRRRYTPDMRSDRFQPDQHWRKSSQWFTLNRKWVPLRRGVGRSLVWLCALERVAGVRVG
jgi:hypothetical protein